MGIHQSLRVTDEKCRIVESDGRFSGLCFARETFYMFNRLPLWDESLPKTLWPAVSWEFPKPWPASVSSSICQKEPFGKDSKVL